MDIAAILKYCPEGTKLYSPAYGKVNFIEVTSPLTIKIKLSKLFGDNIKYFFNNGSINIVDGECMLFPSKEQRDWNKFRLPVKRGDIMMNIGGECPFIATGEMDDIAPKYICGINSLGRFQPNLFNRGWTSDFYIPASEETKKELFDKIKEAGYKWNADTLELEKIKPKFKEGDILINKNTNTLFLYSSNTFMDCNVPDSSLELASEEDRNKFYSFINKVGYKYDKEQHKLTKQIFKPFDKVLVRNDTNEKWSINLFSYYDEENKHCPYFCLDGRYIYCIPYEGNEYVLGTTINII
ncbi:hypothetical protein [uncultured Clostridium sp.]|uniref:hypothetical protein n=1 Tax=uncultured Clostridium sp. TaxID=59620 RepID=UPI0025D0128C|nr:hypothetical protein [uncultured Clostridium sp.]